MSKQLVGNAANFYLSPLATNDGESAKFAPMIELILFTIEAHYALDAEHHIVKSQKLDTTRTHLDLEQLGQHIRKLTALREQLEAFAIADEQQRAGVDPAQLSLPGV